MFLHAPSREAAQRGQSMLEAVIACGIIVTAIASSLTLVQSAVTGSKDSETSITAANLAREGVEVVRAQRDGNWLADAAFDAGLSSGTDYSAIAVFAPVSNSWSLNYAPNAVTEATTLVYRHTGTAAGSTNGLMVQVAAAQPANTATTLFRRLILTEPICENPATGVQTVATSGSNCTGLSKVGLRVLSRVQWQLGNRTRSIQAEERMYDWR